MLAPVPIVGFVAERRPQSVHHQPHEQEGSDHKLIGQQRAAQEDRPGMRSADTGGDMGWGDGSVMA